MNLALPREDLTAGLLAAIVHGAFFLLLVFGLSWQIQQPAPIIAELWQELPPPLTPADAVTPEPEPEPVPTPQPDAADIALEKQKREAALKVKQEQAKKLADEKKAKEEKKKLAEQKKKQEEADQKRKTALAKLKQEEARQRELDAELEAEQAAMEKARIEQQRKLAEQKRREALKAAEEALQKQMMDEAASEVAAAKARAVAAQRASEIGKLVALYKAKISDRVRSYTRLPEGLAGNPEAEFEVSVLPTGEVTQVRLIKGSGNVAYDEEVLRGIKKASPLPLPSDREALEVFRKFILKHRAKE